MKLVAAEWLMLGGSTVPCSLCAEWLRLSRRRTAVRIDTRTSGAAARIGVEANAVRPFMHGALLRAAVSRSGCTCPELEKAQWERVWGQALASRRM